MVDSGDEAHRRHERLPGVALAGEDAPPFRCKAIEAPAALAGLFHPTPLHPATLFEAVQQRIQRRDVELQLSTGTRFDQLADLVAVACARFDDRQDDELRRSFLQFTV